MSSFSPRSLLYSFLRRVLGTDYGTDQMRLHTAGLMIGLAGFTVCILITSTQPEPPIWVTILGVASLAFSIHQLWRHHVLSAEFDYEMAARNRPRTRQIERQERREEQRKAKLEEKRQKAGV